MYLIKIIHRVSNQNLDEKSQLFHYLVEANKKSDWIWTIYFKCMIGVFMNTATMAGASVVMNHFLNGSFDTNNLYHPFKYVLVVFYLLPTRKNTELCVVIISQIS